MRWLFPIIIFCSFAGVLWVLAEAPLAEHRVDTGILVADHASAQVRAGAQHYYQHCAVCHGDTLGGLAEARTAFPADKQRCERCHRRNNPATMSMMQMTWRNAFSIGEGPALARMHAPQALATLSNGAALYNYIRNTMPRPFPASLSEEQYLAISAFLLAVNGVDVSDALNIDDLARLTLTPIAPVTP